MVSFRVKYINYFGDKRPVLLQSENGPCPLLALVNILLLKHKLSLPKDAKRVEFDYLSDIIIDYIQESNAHSNVDQLKSTVLDMQYGINVDCGFENIYHITISSSIDLFKHLGINFVHGWIVSSYDTLYYPILNRFTYNKLMDQLVLYQTQDQTNGSNTEMELSTEEFYIVNDFITNYPSQLTEEGLIQLSSNLQDRELATLFYNNHCTVLLKHENELYCLVTDVGFSGKNCVWEKLDNIYNDTVFYNDKFQQYTPEMDGAKSSSSRKRSTRGNWLGKLVQKSTGRSSQSGNTPGSSARKNSKCKVM